MKQARIHCPYCGSLATLRPASAIHGLSDISAGTYLYVCRRWPACDAYVTADRRTKQPLGTLANGELRHKRILAHHALHNVQTSLGMNRDQSYRWLLALQVSGIPLTAVATRMSAPPNHVSAWISRAVHKLRNDESFLSSLHEN